MLLYMVGFLFMNICYGEKSLKVDIYPGFGWDHLRFMDLSPLFAVSNFNDSDIFQNCIEVIPMHENKIETGSSAVDVFDSKKSEYSSNFMIGGKAGFFGFQIGASYSNEYQKIKEQQNEEKSIILHNQINYLMVDVVLLTKCPLSEQVKQDLIDIAKYGATNQTLMATYAAQLFIKNYGTHFVNRIHLGGSISEEDFILYSNYESKEYDKRLHKAAAEASFKSVFSLSTSFSSSFSETEINRYQQNITRKIINSKGGDVFILGSHMATWQASVKTKPAIIRRGIENITSIVEYSKIPELDYRALAYVREKLYDAVETYIELNTVRGCMKRGSPSFNWVANVDDGSCAPTQQRYQFGGFIQSCSEDSRLTQRCSSYRIRNYYTGSEQCKSDFTKYLVYQTVRYERLYRRNCKACGFLWLSTCCTDIYIGDGRRDISLFGCHKNATQQFGISNIDSTNVYGGSFTSQKVNPVTNSYKCPEGLTETAGPDGIKLCLAERIFTSMKDLPFFGGIFSCSTGNPAVNINSKTCPTSYSIYSMGTVDGNCFLSACLKFEEFNQIYQLPPIVLPPFLSIKEINLTSEINDTMESGIITSRMMGEPDVIELHSLSMSNSIFFQSTTAIRNLFIGIITFSFIHSF